MPDPLSQYNAKRDFTRTAEPAGKVAKGAGNRFIVQKHDATRLHWDFRLEVDGVLKSWAVTRGPSLDPDDKRLAVRTEDHPMSYADFEGTIPAGEYGGGTVMLWDVGSWAPIAGKSAKDIDAGHLHFTLDGERMKGEWLLVRMKGRPKEKRENWLLRKVADAAAGGSDDLVAQALTSVKTGRTMAQIAAGEPGSGVIEPAKPAKPAKPKPKPKSKARAAAQPMPAFQPPQLATLVNAVPSGSQWLHEVKYDGYRALVAIGGGQAKVFTRSGLDWTDKFPAIAEAAAALDVQSALIDGEIVAYDADGKPDFSTLQAAIKDGGALTLFAFDLLSIDGEDLTGLANLARKERLRPLVPAQGAIRFAEHVVGAGEQLFEAMCREGYEGVVSKQADAPYSGTRSAAWLKIKCIQRQEFVIVGWAPSARRKGFASLLLGVHDDNRLRYAGRVGTGFNAEAIDTLSQRLAGIERKTAPLDVPRPIARGAHWVEPKLVAEVAFAEFTADGVVRHASFIGLRGDKPAAQVVREQPVAVPDAADSQVKISNADRVIFDDSDVTKGDLAQYYTDVAGVMLTWAGNRPVSLVRCPQGRARACFFQKHDAGSFGDQVHQVPIVEKDGHTENYLYVDSTDGLRACVQMGGIEFHGWGSSVATLEQPDRLVIDLDPDEGLGFDAVKSAAVHIRDALADMGLVSFPLLSGGKGVHIVVPLKPQAEWPVVKDFAQRFATALAQAEPKRFVATMAKVKRKGRIFIDWLRNQRGSTAVMPYSARARAGAPVAAPVTWSELEGIDTAARYTVRDAQTLLTRAAAPDLVGWGIADQVLPDV